MNSSTRVLLVGVALDEAGLATWPDAIECRFADDVDGALEFDELDFDAIVCNLEHGVGAGLELLGKWMTRAPATLRLAAGSVATLSNASGALNDLELFRILVTPVGSSALRASLESAARFRRVLLVEDELLEQTLRGSVEALLETLSLANPAAFARAVRIKDVVDEILDVLAVEDRWAIDVAAMLSQLGAVTLPDSTLEKVYLGLSLTEVEQEMVEHLPDVAAELLAGIPRLDAVRAAILEQHAPSDSPSDSLSFAGRVLRIAVAFESLVAASTAPDAALATLRQRYPNDDAPILDGLRNLAGGSSPGTVIQVEISALRPGMVLESEVRSASGTLVVGRGQVITRSLADLLKNYAAHNAVTETVSVLIA